jgi:hypothetical protein
MFKSEKLDKSNFFCKSSDLNSSKKNCQQPKKHEKNQRIPEKSRKKKPGKI